MTRAQARRRPRTLRWLTVGLVLAVVALVVPDASVKSTEMVLVHADGAGRASAVALRPDTVWILAVGSDARPGEDMTHVRGDALQLIGMNTRTGAATAIGIPRDSWVSIPGHGTNKINAALYFGGPRLLGRTVGDLVGVQPDYVFITRFEYFSAMIKSIGGVWVRNPVAFSDVNLKKEGFRQGRIHLGPYDALVFSRIRHNLLRGDFDRSANQQRVLRGIQRQVHDHAAKPGFLSRGILSAIQHLHTDLPPAELYRLGQAMAQVDPAKVTTCVVQGSIGEKGGASVVLPFVDQARRYGADARRDATIRRC